ncbi:hypothetical protein [Massilia sp. PWRC2]|uniref:hypothetical protein n=1 Tax=Massilia sp. PWRC2 TaxID=2804626 RepID=UPI003CF6C79B
MQNQQTPATAPAGDPGFKLPGGEAGTAPAKTAAASAATPGLEVAGVPAAIAADTSNRDLAIGASAFVMLLVIFFFVRNAYVHHLVVRRVAPSTAGSAGWMMFVGFCFISAAAVLALVNAGKFLTFAITGPLLAVGLIALVATLFVGRR